MKTKIELSGKKCCLVVFFDGIMALPMCLLMSFCIYLESMKPDYPLPFPGDTWLFGFALLLFMVGFIYLTSLNYRFWKYSRFEIDSVGFTGTIYGYNSYGCNYSFELTWERLAQECRAGSYFERLFLPIQWIYDKERIPIGAVPKLSWIKNLAEVRDALKDVPDNPVKRLLIKPNL